MIVGGYSAPVGRESFAPSTRSIGKGSATINPGVSQVLLNFTRRPGERVIPTGFITTVGDGPFGPWDIGWAYVNGGGDEPSLQFYVRNSPNAGQGALVCRNGQAQALNLDWELLGVMS